MDMYISSQLTLESVINVLGGIGIYQNSGVKKYTGGYLVEIFNKCTYIFMQ